MVPTSLLPRPATSTPWPELLGHGLVTPLDGSPYARAALPVATALALQAGSSVDVLAVVPADGPSPARAEAGAELERALRRLGDLAGKAQLVTGADPAAALVSVTRSPFPPLVCMASHGFARLTASPLSDVTEQVIARAGAPVAVVGPLAAPGPGGAPVAVLLDGGPADIERAAIAVELAAGLGTSALAIRPAVGDGRPGRAAGAQLAERLDRLARRRHVDLLFDRSDDPVSPTQATCASLERHPAQLLVVGRGGPGVDGTPTATGLIHRCPVPVVVAPL